MNTPSSRTAKIGIVGMGAVGTATSIHLVEKLLCRRGGPPVQLHTFEQTSSVGAGLAYSTRNDFHLLNMRARTMSLSREAPGDFTDWLQASDQYRHEEYVPRRLFGDYVRQRFAETLLMTTGTRVSVVQHQAEVTDCEDVGGHVQLTTSTGRMQLDQVIMCPGHLPRRAADGNSYRQSPRYLPSAWAADRYDQIPLDATVGILGTSLTAVDVLLTLENRSLRGPMLCFSRKRGLPKVQGAHVDYRLQHITYERLRQLTEDFTRELSLLEVQALFAQELERVADADRCWPWLLPPTGTVADTLEHDIREAAAGRTLWYSVLDATSTIVPLIWRHLQTEAKAHFLAEHESIWATFRHCMPATSAKKLLAMARADRLDVHTGLERISYDQRRAQFDLVFRHQGQLCQRRVDYLIDATGTTFMLDQIEAPLLENMRRRGQLLAHPLGGVEVDFSSSQLLYRDRVKSRRIYLVGALTRGVHYYTNSFEMNRDRAESATNLIVSSLLRREAPSSSEAAEWTPG